MKKHLIALLYVACTFSWSAYASLSTIEERVKAQKEVAKNTLDTAKLGFDITKKIYHGISKANQVYNDYKLPASIVAALAATAYAGYKSGKPGIVSAFIMKHSPDFFKPFEAAFYLPNWKIVATALGLNAFAIKQITNAIKNKEIASNANIKYIILNNVIHTLAKAYAVTKSATSLIV